MHAVSDGIGGYGCAQCPASCQGNTHRDGLERGTIRRGQLYVARSVNTRAAYDRCIDIVMDLADRKRKICGPYARARDAADKAGYIRARYRAELDRRAARNPGGIYICGQGVADIVYSHDSRRCKPARACKAEPDRTYARTVLRLLYDAASHGHRGAAQDGRLDRIAYGIAQARRIYGNTSRTGNTRCDGDNLSARVRFQVNADRSGIDSRSGNIGLDRVCDAVSNECNIHCAEARSRHSDNDRHNICGTEDGAEARGRRC